MKILLFATLLTFSAVKGWADSKTAFGDCHKDIDGGYTCYDSSYDISITSWPLYRNPEISTDTPSALWHWEIAKSTDYFVTHYVKVPYKIIGWHCVQWDYGNHHYHEKKLFEFDSSTCTKEYGEREDGIVVWRDPRKK